MAGVAAMSIFRQASKYSEPTYRTVRESAYQAVHDDALDELATKAIRFAFLAGRFHETDNASEFHREFMRAMADATAFRLQERCMAYEHLLRTQPVPEWSAVRR
jgi:hypothetical protein